MTKPSNIYTFILLQQLWNSAYSLRKKASHLLRSKSYTKHLEKQKYSEKKGEERILILIIFNVIKHSI